MLSTKPHLPSLLMRLFCQDICCTDEVCGHAFQRVNCAFEQDEKSDVLELLFPKRLLLIYCGRIGSTISHMNR